MFEDDFDPYETMMRLVEAANAQAKLLEELTKVYNRHERMLHHLADQNEILREQHEIDRQQIVNISMTLSEILDDPK